MTVKIRLKGHGSFYIREGWLTKGLNIIENDKYAFVSENPTDEFGIGANMVSSLRYWLQAVGLTEENSSGRRYQKPTIDFGDIIKENDIYFEEKFTLWLLHYKLVTNISYATSWYLFFNKFDVFEFKKAQLVDTLEQKLLNLNPTIKYSKNSLVDDCSCILQTYRLNDEDLNNPEDNLVCPFTALNLISCNRKSNSEEVYIKNKPMMKDLDKLAVLYVILDNLDRKKEDSTSIENLLNDDMNIGKVFNIDKNMINEYLDMLEKEGYLKVNRTAGLNVIYPQDRNKKEVLNKYYESKTRGEA